MNLHTQLEIAKKVKKVIESCESKEQLDVARNYLNLFFKKYTIPAKGKYRLKVVEADHSTVKLYNNLFKLWEDKSKLYRELE